MSEFTEQKTEQKLEGGLSRLPTDVLLEELMSRASAGKLSTQEVGKLWGVAQEGQEKLKKQEAEQGETPKETAKTLAEKFADAVEARVVYGKLPKETTLDGRSIVQGQYASGFYTHGPDRIPFDRSSSALENNIYKIHREPRLSYLADNHYVLVINNPEQEGRKIISILFLQDRKAPDSRGYYTPAHVSVSMQTERVKEFIEAIKKDPDLLETFYQTVFKGLDSRPESTTGMRRTKAGGFYILDEETIKQIPPNLSQYDTSLVRSLLGGIERYKYSQPYGVGEPYTKE